MKTHVPAGAVLGVVLLLAAGCGGHAQAQRDVAAAKLKMAAVRTEPAASTAALERVHTEFRSPDGSAIVHVLPLARGRESQRSRLAVSGAGGQRVILADAVNFFGLAWSPDGTKIAFSEGAVVHIADRDGTTRQTIYTGPGGPYPGACFDLAWTDGGRTLSFTQVENAEQLDLSTPVRVIITLE